MRPDRRLESAPLLRAANRTMLAALAVLVLTTVHHVYGAYIYDTPWRNHVAHVSGVVGALIVGSVVVLRRRLAGAAGRLAFWVLTLAVVAVPVVGIGIFEGGYNHVLKDALHFAGASPDLMRRLFPPPAYELPNDVFFEVTGVLQLVAGAVSAYQLYGLVRARSGG